MNTGEPRLQELREQAADERIEVVGRELRSLMHRAVPEPETEPA
jgi:ketol-acid reductoisomerase